MLPTATTTSYSASIVKTMVKVLAVVCLVVIVSLQTMGVGLFPTFNSSFEKVLAIASEVAATSPTIPNGVRANNNAVDFSGSYADPNHPNCLREIKVTDSIADITGTDGNPGCPPDGSGDPWELTGTVDGDTILVDFSPKGGPKDLKGVYEESPVPGIRWPDGNMWSRKKSAVDFSGSYADPNHPNCLREIKVTYSIADITGTDGNPGCPPDGSGDPWELTGIVDGDTILVDFSPKGGPKDFKGVYEETPVPGIRWPDGNMWTRKKSAHLRK